MNQQQDSQESSSQFENDKEQSSLASPWVIQGKGSTYKGLKSEHPSTYDESIPPLSYGAQDHPQPSYSSPKVEASPTATHKTTPETNTPKMAQRPYNQYTGGWQVPPWARPQQNNSRTISPLVWSSFLRYFILSYMF